MKRSAAAFMAAAFFFLLAGCTQQPAIGGDVGARPVDLAEAGVPEEPAEACGAESLVQIAESTLEPKSCVVGTECSFAIIAVGGSGSYVWKFVGLPSGLSSTDNSVSGKPTEPLQGQVAVVATDAECESNYSVGAFEINVSASESAPALDPCALPAVAILDLPDSPYETANGNEFEMDLGAAGGSGTYIWEITGLPAGLAYNTATGKIGGWISTTGVFNVQVKLSDSACTTNTMTAELEMHVMEGYDL